MEVIRELSEDDGASSDVEYTSFQTTDSVPHLKEEVQAEVFAREYKSSHSCSFFKCCEVIALVIAVCVIWMGMSVPSVLYFIALSKSNQISPDLGYSNQSNNSCNVYTAGRPCEAELSRLHHCLYQFEEESESKPICIASNVDQETVMGYASYLDLGIISSKCEEQIVPFACLYLFPLEYHNDLVRPSRHQCEVIQDVCSNILPFVPSDLVPKCKELPQSSINLWESCNATIIKDVENATNCSDGFFPSNGTCLPECQQWSEYSHKAVLISNILIIVSAFSALLSGFAVLILGCIRCKKIFSCPSIFIVYQTIPLMILAVLVLIGFTARKELFCRHKNLLTSILKPTAFCIITGIAFHYFFLQLLVWWISHVIAVSLGTLSPLKMNHLRASKKLKYMHIVAVILGIVLPMGPLVAFGKIGRITMTRFPTILCTSSDKHVTFGLMVVPMSIIIAMGSTLLVFVFRTVVKRHIQARIHQLRVRINWVTEAKVLTILVYYVILGSVVLTILTNSLIALNGFYEASKEYFSCEASPNFTYNDMGQIQSSCSGEREQLGNYSNPIATTLAFVLLGFYPAINLVYTINIRELKEALSCKAKRKVEAAHRSVHARGNIQSTNSSAAARRQLHASSIHMVPNTFRPLTYTNTNI